MSNTNECLNQTPFVISVTPERFRNLRYWNISLAIIHLVQAGLILFLTTDFAIPVLTSYIDGPPEAGGGTLVTATLFNLRIGWAVALFFFSWNRSFNISNVW